MSDSTDSLRAYFENTCVCRPDTRRVGIEIETLFVDKRTESTISRTTSQSIFRDLVANGGWLAGPDYFGTVNEIEKKDFVLKYDGGWNLLELVTPPFLLRDVDALVSETRIRLQELYLCADAHGASQLERHYDGEETDTLIPSSALEELDIALTGPSLIHQAHAAAVHYNFDLTSVDEGFEALKVLHTFFKQKNWPRPESRASWRRMFDGSLSPFEETRYGPPPLDFESYLSALKQLNVYINKSDGGYALVTPPRPLQKLLDEGHDIDFDIFVTLVWWWSRFRVRDGSLVLEVRPIPRGMDVQIGHDLNAICLELGWDIAM